MFEFLKRVGNLGQRAFGSVGNVLRRFGETAAPVVRSIGRFVAQHHTHLAPLAHGLAVASGNENLQKLTGLGLAVSNLANTLHKKRLDAENNNRNPT